MRHKRRVRVLTNLNVTPLIDIMFMQIIFFMVSSTLVVHHGMLVKLPEAKNAKLTKESKLVVYITKDDKLYVNKDEISPEYLKERIQEFIINTGKKDVTIKSDKEVVYGKIIKIIDICKESGILNISFTTKKVENIEY